MHQAVKFNFHLTTQQYALKPKHTTCLQQKEILLNFIDQACCINISKNVPFSVQKSSFYYQVTKKVMNLKSSNTTMCCVLIFDYSFHKDSTELNND